jgi:phosphoserine aminotransferase
MKKSFLTPGPSELYFTAADHIREALQHNICEISHRSKAFQDIVQHTITQLRTLFDIPADYHIVFTASATEIWERIIQNLSAKHTYHLVNGSFSSKFYDFAVQLGRETQKYQVPENQGFERGKINIQPQTELICLTHNETSTGVAMPLNDIYYIRNQNPDALIALDMVSSAPYPDLDFKQVDTAFFSVQKCFGLPAGLGVWIFNDRCVQKAEQLQKDKQILGTYHTVAALLANINKYETPETPNMLGIYLLGKVAQDMNSIGIQQIRNSTNYKAALLYDRLAKSKTFKPAVENKDFRSQTVIVAEGSAEKIKEFLALCQTQNLIIGTGYGKAKDTQMRIANFPTHSKEVFEKVADLLEKM